MDEIIWWEKLGEVLRIWVLLIGGSVIATIGLLLAVSRTRAAMIQAKVAGDRQITETFTRAVGQLGSDKVDVRVGAIFALESLSRYSPKDAAAITHILVAFLQEHAPARGSRDGSMSRESPSVDLKVAVDVQTALTVLGRRDVSVEKEKRRQAISELLYETKFELIARTEGKASEVPVLSLDNLDLRGADLSHGDFSHSDFHRSLLDRVRFYSTDISYTDFRHASLRGAGPAAR